MAENDQSQVDNYDLEGGGGSGFENPWLPRTLGREAFYPGATKGGDSEALKKDGEARCFVIRRSQSKNFYGGVRFWLQVAVRDDLSVIAAPFHSCARLNEGWTYISKYSNPPGKVVLGIKNPPIKKCPLARLVKAHPELIAPMKFKDEIQYWPARDGVPGEAKRDFKKLFALEVYEILFEYMDVADPQRPGQTMRVAVAGPDGKPKYTINPKPYIWELNEIWWNQLRSKVLVPDFGAALEPKVADIDGPVEAPKKLPTRDVSKIVLKLWAKTDKKDPSRAEYVVDFSAGLMVDSSAIVPEDELPSTPDGIIDWDAIYRPMTDEDAMQILAKASDADGSGQEAPPPMGGQAASAQELPPPPPPSDDDIPF